VGFRDQSSINGRTLKPNCVNKRGLCLMVLKMCGSERKEWKGEIELYVNDMKFVVAKATMLRDKFLGQFALGGLVFSHGRR